MMMMIPILAVVRPSENCFGELMESVEVVAVGEEVAQREYHEQGAHPSVELDHGLWWWW